MKETRVLVFGALGQIGTALRLSAGPKITVISHDLAQTDICDRDAVARAIEQTAPTVVINCAAFTRVDDAETQRDEAFAANGVAPGLIADACTKSSVRLIHLSTDYVFDGKAHVPYLPDATVAPINVYGASKLDGERRVLANAPTSVVLRTAWVHSGGGVNFIKTVVRLLTSGTPMRVVDDQIGTPTRAASIAEAIWRLVAREDVRGVLHFTDAGVASWFDVAVAVEETLRAAGRLREGVGVLPSRTEDFPRPARRPMFSVLDKHASWDAIGFVPAHWREGVIASTMEMLNA